MEKGVKVKVSIYNVKFSENLGDGVISECFEYILKSLNIKYDLLDLSRKTEFPNNTAKTESPSLKSMIVHFFRSSPFSDITIPILNIIFSSLLVLDVRKKAHSNFVFIGGGQLISGAELFFPSRLIYPFIYAKLIWSSKIAFYSVGVSGKWHFLSRFLFREMLKRSYIYVRDTNSAKKINNHFNLDSSVVPDLGLIASLAYPKPNSKKHGVGFCISSQGALEIHSARAGDEYGIDFYLSKISILLINGYKVRLFTNGLYEDHRFMKTIYNACVDTLPNTSLLTIEKRFTSPIELVEFISSCECIFAHRMHACIVAISFGIPAFGFGWDDKLESFYSSAKLDQFFISIEDAPNFCPIDKLTSTNTNELSRISKELVNTSITMHMTTIKNLLKLGDI